MSRVIYKYNKKALKAATLLEAMIAMVIISIITAICSVIYINATDNSNQQSIISAIQITDKIKTEVETEKKYIDEEIAYKHFKVIKSFSNISEDLIELTVLVREETKTVYSAKYLLAQ